MFAQLPRFPLSVFTVHCLASGSSANAFLVTCPDGGILIDAGLGMRTLRRYIEERGIPPEKLAGICVTHEHHDHSVGAIPYACRWKVPVIGTEGTLTALQLQDAARREPLHTIIPRDGELTIGPFTVRSFPYQPRCRRALRLPYRLGG
ncbi:MAG: MBL fold metallo-hydrolase [Armatimonas sp.]